MGPITLIDKSFLQSLSFDEAGIFDCLYSTNICPIFFVETLADLKKAFSNSTPEKEVGLIAGRTPAMHSNPNVHHRELCLGDLGGQTIEMRRVPVLGGGIPVKNKDGRVGIFYDVPPEQKAFSRWHQGKFDEIEQEFAAVWRRQLQLSDLKVEASRFLRRLGYSGNPKSLKEAREYADKLVRGDGRRFSALRAAWESLGEDPRFWPHILQRWKKSGGPALPDFAPYAAHCLTVDAFFYICIDKGLISADRPSNKIDLAYLYYLPFCMLFTSSDKLHAKIAPLFMTHGQRFVPGTILKAELSKLNVYFSGMADAIAKHGLIRVANRPPNGDFLTRELWEEMFGSKVPDGPVLGHQDIKTPEKILDMVKELKNQAKQPVKSGFTKEQLDDPSHVTIERHVRLTMGKWQLFPEGIEPIDE